MDLERQPLSVFIRQAILRTPQGWIVAASFLINWLLAIIVTTTSIDFITPSSGSLMLYVLIVPWPFVVLMVFVSASSPHYQADILATIFTAVFAIAPYWWIYA